MKLGPYLDRILKRDLYISEKHYLVSSKPDEKNKEWVDVLRTTINILLSFLVVKIFIFQSIQLYTKFIG
ncbi:hypothetical protein ACT7DL_18285 [Bacillus paranthracis]